MPSIQTSRASYQVHRRTHIAAVITWTIGGGRSRGHWTALVALTVDASRCADHWTARVARLRLDAVDAHVRLLQQVAASTVTVAAEIPQTHPSASVLGTSRAGTGAVVDKSGTIVTVNYVV